MIHINYSDKDEMLVGQYTVCHAVNHIIGGKSYVVQHRVNIVLKTIIKPKMNIPSPKKCIVNSTQIDFVLMILIII